MHLSAGIDARIIQGGMTRRPEKTIVFF